MASKIPTPKQMRERFEFQKDLLLEEDAPRDQLQCEAEKLLSQVEDCLEIEFSHPNHGYVIRTITTFDDVAIRLANETLFGHGWELRYCGFDRKQLMLLPLGGW